MFKINRQALAEELSLLQSVAERKGVIPILQFVRFQCDGETATLTATDLDVTLTAQIPFIGEPWNGCIPLRQLLALAKLLAGDEVKFTERSKSRIKVSSEQSKHLLAFEVTENFPETVSPKAEKTILDGQTLSRMVKATSFWVRDYDGTLKHSELIQTGLSVRSNGTSLEVMAFNGKAAAIATQDIETPKCDFILPRQAASALERFNEELEVVWDESRVSFSGKSRTLIARTLEGKFPDWKAFLPIYEHQVKLPEEFKAVTQRASVTSQTQYGYFLLKLTIAKEFVKLESQGGDNGQSEESLSAQSTLNGKEVVIGVNGHQLLKVLSVAGKNVTCEFVDGNQPVILIPVNEGFDLRYLTMPCRLSF